MKSNGKLALSLILAAVVWTSHLRIAQAADGWVRPWGATAGVITSDFVAAFLPQSQAGSEWKNPVDESARELLRGDDIDSRLRSRVLSDFALSLSIAAPLANGVFAGFEPNELRPSRVDREWLGFTALQAYGATWAIVETLKRITGRSRPGVRDCMDTDQFECSDLGSESFRSFPSGHTAFAFAGAGLLCLQTQSVTSGQLPIGGSAACPAALGLAAITGYFRVQGDAHWLTDVLAGAAIGLAGGMVIPTALSGSGASGADTQGGIRPSATAPPLFFASIPF